MSDSPFGTPGEAAKSTTFEYTLPPEGEESSFYVKPATYAARVADIESKVSKSGNPMWVIKFRVVQELVEAGKQPVNQDGAEKDKELSLFLVTTKQAAWKVRPAMAALGMIKADGVTISFTPQDVIGKGATIVVVDSDYNGKKSSSVDDVRPLPQGYVLPKPDDVPF